MPAIKVYGISIGDVFEGPSGGTLTVESFETPTSHTKPWKAWVRNDAGEAIHLEVEDLKQLEKIS